jgi:hypothetical protein
MFTITHLISEENHMGRSFVRKSLRVLAVVACMVGFATVTSIGGAQQVGSVTPAVTPELAAMKIGVSSEATAVSRKPDLPLETVPNSGWNRSARNGAVVGAVAGGGIGALVGHIIAAGRASCPTSPEYSCERGRGPVAGAVSGAVLGGVLGALIGRK